jgi:hypothetical protein
VASRRAWLRAVGVGLVAGAGCRSGGWGEGDALRVVTDWSDAELAEFLSPGEGQLGAPEGVTVRAVRPVGGIEPAALVGAGVAGDVVLGGPLVGFARLAAAGRLLAVSEAEGDRPWRAARRAVVGVAARDVDVAAGGGVGWEELGEERWGDRLVMADPGRDATARAAALDVLGAGAWAEGYASLVRAAGQARAVAETASAALARAVDSAGVAALVGLPAALAAGLEFWPLRDQPVAIEGVAVLRSARDPARARAFVEAVAARVPSDSPHGPGARTPRAIPDDPRFETLVGDLLGAVLREAHPELRQASRVLRRPDLAERPGRAKAERDLVEPPPWPPASIDMLRRRPDGDGLIAALARQMVPAAGDRVALVRLLEPGNRRIDAAVLQELAAAAEGRLVAEPRVRAWLRAEWATWARQRYRRAARLATGEFRPA